MPASDDHHHQVDMAYHTTALYGENQEPRPVDHHHVSLKEKTPLGAKPNHKWGIFPAPPTEEPGPPPDGGARAWLQVLAGHFMCFVTWGLITSFGIFQSTYEDMLHAAPSTVSWIGTVQIFTLLLVGTLSGRASDAGLVHEAVLAGTFLIVFGLFMTSLATQYYQLFLAQGVCIGLGMGILYMPGLSVPSSYFKAKKPLAVAIIASGAGSGGLVYPAMAQQLLPRVGFGWTMRSIAFVTLLISFLINLLLRVRVPARRSGPLADLRAFTELPYIFFTIGFFLIYWAVYFAFYYIDLWGYTYASFSSLDSINILLITNALGIPGRVLPGFIAARYLGPLNTAIPTAVSVAVVLYCWPAVAHAPGPLYGFAVAYGLVASAIQSLFAVSLAALTDDLSQLGTRMGMVFSVVAFASLTGSPIAGAIVEASGGDYLGSQLWAATSMLLGAVALAAARVSRTGWVLRKQV
ncbi:MFS general substrate transporter [Xylariaceae sp. FL0016]|nr:MFS general substrate transporter [Xylariaceae sp. FL0016]